MRTARDKPDQILQRLTEHFQRRMAYRRSTKCLGILCRRHGPQGRAERRTNNGWEGPNRGHGHGIYIQNQTGTKLMADNIVFDRFSFGLHAYAEGGFINNLTMDGNILFFK